MVETSPEAQAQVAPPATVTTTPEPSSPLPRVTIRFCTQCKWLLRAAYFAQELLSTFSTALGEVALQPSTGGTFVVEIFYSALPGSTAAPASSTRQPSIQQRTLWDRKIDGGFPETKELKRRVRDIIEPDRNLGHVDRDHPRPQTETAGTSSNSDMQGGQQPSGPRWPVSDAAAAAARGQSTAQQTSETGDTPRKGWSLPMIPADPPAASDDPGSGSREPPTSRKNHGVPETSAETNALMRERITEATRLRAATAQEAKAEKEAEQECEDCK